MKVIMAQVMDAADDCGQNDITLFSNLETAKAGLPKILPTRYLVTDEALEAIAECAIPAFIELTEEGFENPINLRLAEEEVI